MKPLPTQIPVLMATQNTRELARALGISYRKTFSHVVYRISDNLKYKTFEIPKKNGDARTIHRPRKVVRDIQKRLLPLLEEIYQPPPYAHGYIKGRSIVTNSMQHLRRKYVANFDLVDFFPNIHFKRIESILTSDRYRLKLPVARAIAQICCRNGSLPIGAPTSGIVANIVCGPLDSALGRHAKSHGLRYTRYADDLTFSASSEEAIRQGLGIHLAGRPLSFDISEVSEKITQLVVENGFKINKNKVRVQSKRVRQSVTGIVVNKKLNVPIEYYRNLRGAIHAVEQYGFDKAQELYKTKYSRTNWSNSLKYNIIGRLSFLGNITDYNDRYIRLAVRAKRLFPEEKIYVPLSQPELTVFQLTTKIDNDEGTAFHIGGGYFLTAAHIFDKNSEARFASLTNPHFLGVTIHASVKKIDFDLDVALVMANKIPSDLPIVKLADRVILSGDQVTAYGYPQYNEGNSCSQMGAKVTGIRQLGVPRVEVDRAFPHGASGGPVFDAHGFSVGVVCSGPQMGQQEAPMSTTFTNFSSFKTTLAAWRSEEA